MPTNIQQFYKRTVNITDINFTEEELKLMDKGLQHNPGHNNLHILVVDTDIAINNLNIKDKTSLKTYCAYQLKKGSGSTKGYRNEEGKGENRTLGKIKKKIKEENLVITKADKGNTAVILKKDYIQRVEDFLNTNNFEVLDKFNFNNFISMIKTNIKNCTLLFDEIEQKSLIVNNPQIPRLYGLMKLQKSHDLNNIPIRPVVSNINTPVQLLAKHLNCYLKNLLQFKPKYTIKNSNELIEINPKCKCTCRFNVSLLGR